MQIATNSYDFSDESEKPTSSDKDIVALERQMEQYQRMVDELMAVQHDLKARLLATDDDDEWINLSQQLSVVNRNRESMDNRLMYAHMHYQKLNDSNSKYANHTIAINKY